MSLSSRIIVQRRTCAISRNLKCPLTRLSLFYPSQQSQVCPKITRVTMLSKN